MEKEVTGKPSKASWMYICDQKGAFQFPKCHLDCFTEKQKLLLTAQGNCLSDKKELQVQSQTALQTIIIIINQKNKEMKLLFEHLLKCIL